MANNPKKYASDSTLSNLVAKIKELFVKKTDLNTALSGKADSLHKHSISDTTNLQSTLDGKVPTSRTVNSKALTENITLSASDVGAASSTHDHDDKYYTQSQVDTKLNGKSDKTHNHDSDYADIDHNHDGVYAVEGHNHDNKYDAKGTASSTVSTHNTATDTHNDIRLSITELTTKLNNFLDVDDATTDQLSELLTLIENNATDIDSITNGKVNVSDIIDNLTTNVTNKPLSAAQGVAIKALIDDLQIAVNSKVDSLSDLGITATSTELNYVDGVTSNIQTQLDTISDELDNHTHSGSDITSGTVAAARLPKATDSASGIVSTESQTFAGEKTFTSNITTVGLRANAANTNDIGTSLAPFRNTNTKNLYIAPQNIGASISHCGKFIAETTGTTSTKGVTRLEVGNFIEEGREGNAQGYIQIFNNDIGSVILETGHDDDRDIRVYLPENDGTLVTTDDLSGYAKSSHNHSASNIISGTLAIERGGTGNMNGYIQTGALSGSTIGALATAEGRKVTASGSYSHAEGNYTEASGSSAHAEGQSSTASGIASHAEGNNATASGNYSHAEGDFTNASAKGAHAEGTYTLASSDYQHVQGKFNIEDKAGVYAHIVGNGTGTSNSSRSNAHTIDWDGNAWFAGNIYTGGTSQSSGATMLASISPVSTAEYTALEQAQTVNANTLYMLTDAEEEGAGNFIINATIDAEGDGTVDKTAAEITAALDAGHTMVCNATYGTLTTLFRLPLLSSRMVTSTVLGLVFANQNYKVTIKIGGSIVSVSGEIINSDITIGDTTWSGDESVDFTDTINDMIDAKQEQADWNQNDETALDYVKNRTHYSTQTILLPETTLVYDEGQDLFITEVNFEFIEGNSYTVIWNGVEYITTANIFEGMLALGNTGIFEGLDNGEPFIIIGMKGRLEVLAIDEVTELTMSISGEYVEKIPVKYLPTFNLVNGSAAGSIRSLGAAQEDDEYLMGYAAFAEGSCTIASGFYSHAEGSDTIASGDCSHAEGSGTIASGHYSHAEGGGTIARGNAQHVQGQCNIEDTNNKYLHIVGNGKRPSQRSNAHTLDWDGNAWFSGDVYVGSTSGTNTDAGSKKLATEEYVNLNSSSNIFIAEYGVTTFVEIFEAVQTNGKTAFCRTSTGSTLPLAYAHIDEIKFVGHTSNGEQEAICTNSDVWSLNNVGVMSPDTGTESIYLSADKLFYYAETGYRTLTINGSVSSLPNGWFGFLTVFASSPNGVTSSILETASENGFGLAHIGYGNMNSYSMAIFKTGASSKLKWYLFKPLPSAEGASF